MKKQHDLFGEEIEEQKHEQPIENRKVLVAKKIEVVEEIACNAVPCSFHRESATVTWVWNIQKT
jgi:hypothetical protein